MARRAISKAERHIVYRKCNGHCCYCGKVIDFHEMQVDHYFPYSLKEYYEKSTNILVEDGYNLMTSCRSCNHYKRGDTPDAFRTKMKTIHERLNKFYIFKVALSFSITTLTPFDGMFWFEKNRQPFIIYPDDIL